MKSSTTIFTILLLLFTIWNPLFAQTQIGQDIDGVHVPNLTWGQSLSMSFDGKRLAIGVPNILNSGFVRVYELVSNTWVQLGANIDETSTQSNWGGSVSLSADGNRIAIGGDRNNDAGGNAGYVQIYEWTGTNWVQMGTDLNGTTPGDFFGTSVSLSADGNTLAVGALNGQNPLSSGYTRMYQWLNGNWTQIGADIAGASLNDGSGYSVSLSSNGSRVAIGTPFNDNNGMDAGHTSIYELVGGNWTQMGADIDGVAAGDNSGSSVSLSANGNRLAIGAERHNSSTGHTRIFEWTGTNWVQVGADIDGEALGDEAGLPVSLSADGNKIAIGAAFNNGNGIGAGHTRIYEWLGGQWTQIGVDIDGEDSGDYSAWYVALAPDGNSVAISAPLNDDNGYNTGHVRVFSTLLTLPVELTDIKAKAINREVLLKWTTASESNNKGFDIEHSTDGISWQQLDFVRGQGTSLIQNDYTYTHTSPATHINYYRLKQLDYDGAFEYSEVVNVYISGRDIVEVYPNPTHGIITISGIEYDTANITDTSGRNVLTIKNIQPTIDVAHLANGMYFIEIISGNSRTVRRIVKK